MFQFFFGSGDKTHNSPKTGIPNVFFALKAGLSLLETHSMALSKAVSFDDVSFLERYDKKSGFLLR